MGQARACSEITDAMLRDSLQLVPRTRPATWMFAGPSGVGKTGSGQDVAEHLTGQKLIMLNLAEYSQPDQAKLLGSNPGYIGSDSNKELPFDTLESNPYRLILLDELEKAHAIYPSSPAGNALDGLAADGFGQDRRLLQGDHRRHHECRR